MGWDSVVVGVVVVVVVLIEEKKEYRPGLDPAFSMYPLVTRYA